MLAQELGEHDGVVVLLVPGAVDEGERPLPSPAPELVELLLVGGELRAVPPLELGESLWVVPEPRAQLRARDKIARPLVETCPLLGSVKVLRQWAGCYDLTPDANPIVGEVDDIEGFYQASGFMGHGFMMAPVMGRLLAQHIAERTQLPMFERWNLRRFKQGRLLSEAMIIG